MAVGAAAFGGGFPSVPRTPTPAFPRCRLDSPTHAGFSRTRNSSFQKQRNCPFTERMDAFTAPSMAPEGRTARMLMDLLTLSHRRAPSLTLKKSSRTASRHPSSFMYSMGLSSNYTLSPVITSFVSLLSVQNPSTDHIILHLCDLSALSTTTRGKELQRRVFSSRLHGRTEFSLRTVAQLSPEHCRCHRQQLAEKGTVKKRHTVSTKEKYLGCDDETDKVRIYIL